MKRMLIMSSLVSTILLAEIIKTSIPMPASSLSVENSGQLTAIDAYQDGVGIYTVASFGNSQIDNSEMNELVYKYGEESKNTGVLVKDYVNSYGNSAEKIKALGLGKFEPIVPGDNSICNDSNAQTINDIYINGICAGTNVEGVNCNDLDAKTINDIYTNGICAGVNVEGVTCNDANVQTINDIYVNGVCVGTNAEGLICNDLDAKTINDKYINGICVGTNVEGQTCSDLNDQTINDIYTNGICIGTNVEGVTCNDSNAQTINDKYINGICVGTDVEGVTCNDANVQTINDIYTNGICAGTNVEGQTCSDLNAQTINDIYTNGICAGTNVEGQTCSDSNTQTVNDKYVNGECIGITIGTTCNDNNSNTYNDIYTASGSCLGTQYTVVGATCNDNNANTYNDKYTTTTGLCVGSSPVDCQEIKTNNSGYASGYYTIAPNGSNITAYCDMTTNGGGWTKVYSSTNIISSTTKTTLKTSDYGNSQSSDFSLLYSMRNNKSVGTKYEFYIVNNLGINNQFYQTNSYNQSPVNNSYQKISGNFVPFNGSTWYGLATSDYGSIDMNNNCALSSSYEGNSWWNCIQSISSYASYGVGPWYYNGTTVTTPSLVHIYQR